MPQQQEISELSSGKLQAILRQPSPTSTRPRATLGAVEVLDAFSGVNREPAASGYVAMNAWVKDNPTAVADFQAASTQGAVRRGA